MEYDYFYEEQSEHFVFYKVPKVLFVKQEFKELSSDAKLLYGLLLDRASLSQRNNWLDNNGRVYVIYTINNIKDYIVLYTWLAIINKRNTLRITESPMS